MFRRSARPHPDWFRHRHVSMPLDARHARRSDSPAACRRRAPADGCESMPHMLRCLAMGSAGDATAYELRRPPEHVHQRDDPFVIGAFPRGMRIRWIPAGIVHRQGAASVASSNPQRLAWSKAWKYRSFGLFALFRPCRLFQPIRPQHPAPLHRQACRVPVHCPPARRRVKPSANRAYPRSWRPIQGVQKRTSY